MKPHPRIRKTIKWGGAAVTLLLLVVWIASGWPLSCLAWHVGPGQWMQVGAGNLGIVHTAPVNDARLERMLATRRWEFQLCWDRPLWGPNQSAGSWSVSLPMWLLSAPVVLTTVFAWHLDILARRRAKLNICQRCHYDRAGIAADVKCPECGASATAPRARAESSARFTASK